MNRKFKYSRYNVRFTWGNRQYLWNTLTDALIELDMDEAYYIDTSSEPVINDPNFNSLYRNGCILPFEYDELGKVLYEEKAVMMEREPKTLQYTIAPGLGCNYDCIYCFEKGNRNSKYMDEKTLEAVSNYIISATEHNKNLQNIRVTWFGGEPLLYQNAITRISKCLMDYCKEKGVKYSAGIVTNGRLLDVDTAKMLKKLNVRYVQLSFDGMKTEYMKQKRCSEDDFNQTVINICNCADIIPITVRVNVYDDISEAKKLTEFLLKEKGLDGKIKIYIAHIRDYSCSNACAERESHDSFLTLQGQYMRQFGAGGFFDWNSFCNIVPKRRFTTCATVCRTNCCIGPEGELYRCEHFLGDNKHVVGTVTDGLYNNSEDLKYLLFRHPNKCLECNMFPICLGGCMNDAMSGDIPLSCESLKKRWFELLMLNYNEMKGGETT